MLKIFIERPVLSTVISIIIVLLGAISIGTLPIEEYPDIAPPTIKVTASYTGANAETVLESVIIPIEEQINDRTWRTKSEIKEKINSIDFSCRLLMIFDQMEDGNILENYIK